MQIKRTFVLWSFVVLMFLSGGVARSQEQVSGSTAIKESAAIDMAQEWASLVSQANVIELEKLLSDEYIHIHSTALVESKSQFLEAFRNGSRRYDPIRLEELNVRIFGSTAVVIGKFNLRAFVREKTVEGVNRFVLIIVKIESGQQVVSYQATPIPQQK